jgi:hypothetical protein
MLCQESLQAIDRTFEVCSQQRSTVEVDNGALVLTERAPQTRRGEHDEVTGRRVGVIEPWCLLVARAQWMRFEK